MEPLERAEARAESEPLAQPGVGTETEVAACIDCGQPFEREVTLIEGRRIAYPRCSVCDVRIGEENRAHAERIADAQSPKASFARLAAAGVNVRKFGHLTLETMGKSLAQSAALTFALEVKRAGPWDFVRGLYVAGPTGVGKSQLAVSTLRELLEAGYQGRIVFDRARALITTIQDRYGTGTVEQVEAQRRTAGVWCLDDIGTEKPTADAFRILEDMLDAREGHPTILTSNLTPVELAEHWSAIDVQGRLRSRLGPQNYRAVVIEGDDRRMVA